MDMEFEEHIAHVERYLSGIDDRRTIDLLKKKGLKFKPAAKLSDQELDAGLKRLIDACAAIGVYFEHTDHLSDRELYGAILGTVLPGDFEIGGGDWDIHDFAHGQDEASLEAFLIYYADDQDRETWGLDMTLPAHLPCPYDRDRTLPRPANWSDYYG